MTYGGCGKLNETSLPEENDFYSDINMDNITDADHMLAKKILNKKF